MSTKEQKVKVDADYSLMPVPRHARRNIVTMFMIMLGFTFFSASMWTGQELGIGLDLKGFVEALLLGGAILGIYTALLAYVGCKTGLSMDLLAQHSFGKKGSYLPSSLISFTQIGWFGVFGKIAPSLQVLPGEEVIDGTGKMILPPFIESHVHLDTCLTAGDPVWNMSGTLFEGIECWRKRKEKLTKQDVKERAGRAIRMQAANGVQFVRTHVDVTDPKLVAMEAMLELREEL